MDKVLFEEKQRFTQTWLWVGMLGVGGLVIGILAAQLANATGDEADELWKGMVFSLLTLVATSALLLWSVLHVKVKKDGIHYRFPPLMNRWRCIHKSSIKRHEVLQYRPIRDYGGWGYRSGPKGKALNVKGNIGLRLEYGEKDRLLIGTQKPDSLKRAMERLMRNEDQWNV